ncbi:hypothetical protein BD769DRAFT_565132 [Suillus cothurnatus]|nr:hypothetical protein BD769DRAFT_565132 [Suillus cothurnatus]
MRFSSVLAVAAAFVASTFASPTTVDSTGCPILCSDYNCCAGQKCVPQGIFVVSTSVLWPGFNHVTHWRGRSSGCVYWTECHVATVNCSESRFYFN